jgi:hypothetical protein
LTAARDSFIRCGVTRIVLLSLLLVACASPGAGAETSSTGASGSSGAEPTGAASSTGGGTGAAVDEPCAGDVLFGRPVAKTGLGPDQCGPVCSCGGEPWEAPEYGEDDITALLQRELLDPPASLTADPYGGAAPEPGSPDEVCAVISEGLQYRLATYASAAAARADGATPTHFGACGLCSSLADLAVYMRYPDLGAPVTQCGIDNLAGPMEAHLECLAALGFTPPCAQIWYYNTLNTRAMCAKLCFPLIDAPYHTPDGALNDCLQCDEDLSGPIFKKVAGRTRRNTGLASSLCRPCSEVHPLVHEYP